MNRALPAHIIDLIRDGVDAHALARQGHRAVYNALARTACSARQRGWSEVEWADLVDEPGSALGRQNRSDSGGRAVNPAQARKRAEKAWVAAGEWIAGAPDPWSAETARRHAQELAAGLLASVADADTDLTAGERAVLAYIAAVAAQRGSDRLTLARADLMVGSGLGLTALRTVLAALEVRGALVREAAGSPRAKGKPGRANVYRLRALSQSGNPVSGAPTQLGVPPEPVPPSISGAPVLRPRNSIATRLGALVVMPDLTATTDPIDAAAEALEQAHHQLDPAGLEDAGLHEEDSHDQ